MLFRSLDIADQCVVQGSKAVAEMLAVTALPTRHADEFRRLRTDMLCYFTFANAFRQKVLAAGQVLNYKWTKDIGYLEAAVPLLEESQKCWQMLAQTADSAYLYANSMQTAQRRIPVGGDDGKMNTWGELVTIYQAELDALRANIDRLKHPAAHTDELILPVRPATVQYVALPTQHTHPPQPATTLLAKGALLFEARPDTPVDTLAPELSALQALVLNRDTTRIVGTTISFSCSQPVKMLVGFFQDDDPKWAKPPKLETDATGNEYGQAEPVLTNAIAIRQMPPVNIHAYHFDTGQHTIRLPRGIIMVAGFTADDIKPRDAGLQGAGDEVDWLFLK